jgi:hypothetical protein
MPVVLGLLALVALAGRIDYLRAIFAAK